MLLEKLKNYEIYLCSQSPRRRELLKQLDINFIVASYLPVEEKYPKNIAYEDIPVFIARKKAEVYSQILKKNRLLITADTIVVCENKILGKPGNKQNAIQMLKFLSNKKHSVISGVCLQTIKKMHCFTSTTNVWFKELKESEINYYVEKYQPFDKAGAYGIQEWIGMTGIEKIEGSYFNVVGLPVEKLYSELERFLETE